MKDHQAIADLGAAILTARRAAAAGKLDPAVAAALAAGFAAQLMIRYRLDKGEVAKLADAIGEIGRKN